MMAQHNLADCHRVIFLNIVRLSLILQVRRYELILVKQNAKSNQMISSESVILWNQFIFPKPVSIKHASHTNNRNIANMLGKLFICMTHFRKNPLINESFTGDNHFLAYVQRIILLSLVVFVDHDWNGSVGVLWLHTFTLPVCPGLR